MTASSCFWIVSVPCQMDRAFKHILPSLGTACIHLMHLRSHLPCRSRRSWARMATDGISVQPFQFGQQRLDVGERAIADVGPADQAVAIDDEGAVQRLAVVRIPARDRLPDAVGQRRPRGRGRSGAGSGNPRYLRIRSSENSGVSPLTASTRAPRSRNRDIATSSSTRWVTHAMQVEPR